MIPVVLQQLAVVAGFSLPWANESAPAKSLRN